MLLLFVVVRSINENIGVVRLQRVANIIFTRWKILVKVGKFQFINFSENITIRSIQVEISNYHLNWSEIIKYFRVRLNLLNKVLLYKIRTNFDGETDHAYRPSRMIWTLHGVSIGLNWLSDSSWIFFLFNWWLRASKALEGTSFIFIFHPSHSEGTVCLSQPRR